MSKKLQISKELIEEMYKTQTLNDIALELGVSYKTIQRRCKEFGIETSQHINPQFIKKNKTRPKLKKVKPYTKKEAFEKIYQETKSLVLVAKHFNISTDTALKWKHRHNIDTILGVSEEGKQLLNQNKPYTNKEWLEQAYNEHTLQEIANMLNVHVCTIQDWAKRHNIKTRTVAEQRAFKSGNGNKTIFSTYTKEFSKENYLKNIPITLPHTIRKKIVAMVGECQSCGYKEVLDLHHIDGNKFNNHPDNHVILCPNCHAKIHRLGLKLDELVINFVSWYQCGH